MMTVSMAVAVAVAAPMTTTVITAVAAIIIPVVSAIAALAIAVAATVVGAAVVVVTAAEADQQGCGRGEDGSAAAGCVRNTDCPHRTNSNLPSEGKGIFVVIFAYKFTINRAPGNCKGAGLRD